MSYQVVSTTRGEAAVHLEGTVRVTEADGLKSEFQKLLDSDSPVVVDGTAADFLDLAILQLLLALRRELAARGRTIYVHASDTVSGWIRLAGCGELLTNPETVA